MRGSKTDKLDELMKGPCGALANELSSVGVTSSIVTSPEPGILFGPEGAERLTLRRPWTYGMTADQWFHLASEGEQSEIAPCCGNLGELRDLLRELMTFQAPEDIGWRLSLGERVLLVVEADGAGHSLQDATQYPLLHMVMDGIRYEREHKDDLTGLKPVIPRLPDPPGPVAS